MMRMTDDMRAIELEDEIDAREDFAVDDATAWEWEREAQAEYFAEFDAVAAMEAALLLGDAPGGYDPEPF